MKQALAVFTAILIAVYALLSFLDREGEYTAEKVLWHINQRLEKVSQDPSVVPQATFEGLVKDYESFIQRFPKPRLVRIAFLLSGRAFVLKKDYAKARERYEEIVSKFSAEPEVAVEAVMEIAQSYYLQKDEENLINTYERITQQYPLTARGLRVPLMEAQYYAQTNQGEKAQGAFDKAISYYKKMTLDNKGLPVEFDIFKILANCYLAQNKAEEAIKIYGDLLLRFAPTKEFSAQKAEFLVKSINTISVAKLKKFDLPVSIYQGFLEEYPSHPLTPILKKMVDGLRQLE